MATTTIKKGQPGSRIWFQDSFVLHKLHSLSGLFPIGVFLIQHLIANSYSLRGPAEFNSVIKVFGYLPFVAVLEIGLIALPLLFHAIYGFMITTEMRSNMGVYQWGRNWLYWIQRITGIIAFLYIGYHVYSTTGMRRYYEFTMSEEAGFNAINYQAMALRFSQGWYLAIYLVGILATVFHFANGLFNFCIRWGITIGERAQKVSAYIWAFVGVALSLIGIWTATSFAAAGRDLRAQGMTLQSVIRGGVSPIAVEPGATPTPEVVPGREGQR